MWESQLDELCECWQFAVSSAIYTIDNVSMFNWNSRHEVMWGMEEQSHTFLNSAMFFKVISQLHALSSFISFWIRGLVDLKASLNLSKMRKSTCSCRYQNVKDISLSICLLSSHCNERAASDSVISFFFSELCLIFQHIFGRQITVFTLVLLLSSLFRPSQSTNYATEGAMPYSLFTT